MKTSFYGIGLLFVLPLAVVAAACGRDKPAEPAPAASPALLAPSAPSTAPPSPRVRYIERMTGGATTSDAVPLVLAIHGYGDRPESFGRYFERLPVRARLVLPYALFPRDGGGFYWFPLANFEPKALADGMSDAANALAEMLSEIEKTRPLEGKPIVTGFSQGGMLSFSLAVLHPDRVGEAIPVAGMLASPLFPSSWPMGKVAPPILAFHGDADDIVDIAGDRDTVNALSKVGFSAKLTEYPNVRHAVSADMHRDWMAAIEAAVKRAAGR